MSIGLVFAIISLGAYAGYAYLGPWQHSGSPPVQSANLASQNQPNAMETTSTSTASSPTTNSGYDFGGNVISYSTFRASTTATQSRSTTFFATQSTTSSTAPAVSTTSTSTTTSTHRTTTTSTTDRFSSSTSTGSVSSTTSDPTNSTTSTTTSSSTTSTTTTASTTSAGNLIWSSDFATGDFSQWNGGGIDLEGGALATVTSSLAYNGTYSGYYYYLGSPNDLTKRAYPGNTWDPSGPPDFRIDMWIYVPSQVQGDAVQFTDWVSFMSVWINPGYWQYAPPITVDTTDSRQVTLTVQPLLANCPDWSCTGVFQTNPITWPLNQWWELSLQCVLNPGGNSVLTVYQNGVRIISWTGVLPDTGTGTLGSGPVTYNGLSDIHMGLYAGPMQGTFAIYNDDVVVYNLGGSTAQSPASQSYVTAGSTILLGLVGAVVARPARSRVARILR